LQVKGHWIVDTYYGNSENALTEDGWFDTGDVSTVDEDGFMVIHDRTKDVIKSGGEWIWFASVMACAVSDRLWNVALSITNTDPGGNFGIKSSDMLSTLLPMQRGLQLAHFCPSIVAITLDNSFDWYNVALVPG